MGNKDSYCCGRKHNIDHDFEDNDEEEDKFEMKNIKYLIKIQANIRGFLLKKKLNSFLPFSDELIPGIKVDKYYLPNFKLNDPQFIEVIKGLNKLEINEQDIDTKIFRKEYFILYEDGTYYSGQYNKNWKRDGKGILYLTDGSKYEGTFKDNEMHGRGRLINVEGYYYEGEFKNNQANGYGKYYNIDGTNFIGYWRDDLQNGLGEETFLDGSRYEGNYLNGKKNGMGKFIWPGSSYYKGNFEDNEINGEGIYYWKDGRMFSGTWKKNKMEGQGIFFWPDGKTFIGSYQNDKKHGYGLFTWPDGRSYEGEWSNGKQHGFGMFKSKGEVRYGEWNNGEKICWVDKSNKEYETIESNLIKKKVEYEYNKIELKFEKEKQNFNSGRSIFELINYEKKSSSKRFDDSNSDLSSSIKNRK